MAKNSVDSKINLAAVTFIRRDGKLIDAGDLVITFKHKKSGGQRWLQQGYPRSEVAAYGDDFIVVKQHSKLPRAVFREITGTVTIGKDGWLNVDGISINPLYGEAIADLGTEGGGDVVSKKAKATTDAPKKKKKAA